jgi:hypothetical protein
VRKRPCARCVAAAFCCGGANVPTAAMECCSGLCAINPPASTTYGTTHAIGSDTRKSVPMRAL